MENQKLTASQLLDGTAIATRLIAENPDLSENAIDRAINDAFIVSANAQQWEEQARMMLALQAAEAEAEPEPFFRRW